MAKPQRVRISAAVTTSGSEYLIGDVKLGTSRYITLTIEKDYRDKDNNPELPPWLIRVALTNEQYRKMLTSTGHEVVASLDNYSNEHYPIPRASATGAIKDAQDKVIAELREKMQKAMTSLIQARQIIRDSKATRKDQHEAESLINSAVQEINKNTPYMAEVFGREVGNISNEAVTNATEQVQDYLKTLGIKQHKRIIQNANKQLKGGNDENDS